MKIFVNARFLTQPLSGVQRYGIECSRQIKKIHPDVTFIAPKNILHTEIAKELDVRVIGRNTGHLWEQVDLPFFMGRQRKASLLNLANTGPLLCSNSFLTIHDLAFYHHPEWNAKSFSTWYNILIPRLAYSSRQIFTVSETVKREIIRAYKLPANKITIAYNGVSQRMLEQGRTDKMPKEKIILSVGTFNIRKNHQNLIAAYQASPLKDEYQLVIIGDKNKVFREAGIDEQALLNSNIRIYETMTENELINMYKRAELVVSLSLYEGFGIPLLEGLYNGCKILCSDIPVYKEIYGEVAAFCNPLNINEIYDAISTVLQTSKRTVPAGLFEKFSYARSAQIIVDTIISSGK